MAIPLTYNTRNLRMRPGATAMTALGIALTVSTAILIMSLLAGLQQAFSTSGDPRNVLALRKGAEAEMSSYFSLATFNTMRYLPGVARDEDGIPMVSGEIVAGISLPRRDGTGEVIVSLRGMMPVGRELRPQIRLAEGRWWTPGMREVVVSRGIHSRFAGAEIGDRLQFGKGWWTVVGIFEAGPTAYGSEIWTDVHQLAEDFGRATGFSSALLRATDVNTVEELRQRIETDQRVTLQALRETDYYARQTRTGAPIQFVGMIVAVIMAIGSCFAAMNTMYAAVAYRAREIATLRTIGFSRRSILTSFLIESILLALLGGLLGVALMLPFNGMQTGTSNMVTFSEVVFSVRVTSNVIATALLFAVIMGVIGGVAPAWHAAKQNILAALRG